MPFHYAFFSAQYTPHVGGVELYSERLAQELVTQGNTVSVVTSSLEGAPEVELRDDGITVFRLPSHNLLNGRLPISKNNARKKELLDHLSCLKVDRVLVNTRFYAHSLVGLEFAQYHSLPVIVLDHGSAFLTMGNSIVDTVIQWHERQMTEKVKSYNPLFAGVSQKSVKWLETFGIETRVVLPNAIDAVEYRASASNRDFRSEFGLCIDDFVVVFIGRLAPEKGPDKLIDATRLLLDDGIHAILAGSGFLEAKLKAMAPRNVHFTGKLSQDDVSALLRCANLFCLPSRSEGFCTSLLEASAWGVPAVITDVGGARELIPDSSYGLILESADPKYIADALRKMRRIDHQQREAMGERLKERVEKHYSWGNTAQILRESFDNYSEFAL